MIKNSTSPCRKRAIPAPADCKLDWCHQAGGNNSTGLVYSQHPDRPNEQATDNVSCKREDAQFSLPRHSHDRTRANSEWDEAVAALKFKMGKTHVVDFLSPEPGALNSEKTPSKPWGVHRGHHNEKTNNVAESMEDS